MTPVARLREVSHRYERPCGRSPASASTSPAAGVTGLIGPDGVGKSTLLGLIAGAKRLQDGGVEVLGGDMADARHRNAICPRIAFMPQGLGRNLYPELSVRENVDFFGRLFGQGRRERDGADRRPARQHRACAVRRPRWRASCPAACARSSACAAR